MRNTAEPYIGRFAPSPTGPLHFGSLLAAVASFLDARAAGGQWLVRIEDLDPPREQPGAADEILRTLEDFGLCWDGEVLFQSRRHERYRAAIDRLLSDSSAYRCDCSRSAIARRTSATYDGHCRGRGTVSSPFAIRVAVAEETEYRFDDAIQGPQHWKLRPGADDFVIFRRDGFFAYQLAVVIDDAAQGVTHVVRGIDLLDSTPKQIWLQQRLGLAEVHYAHIPVLVNAQGQKLSKQTFAAPLDRTRPLPQLVEALRLLGQQPDPALVRASVTEALKEAIARWRIDRVPRRAALLQPDHAAEGA